MHDQLQSVLDGLNRRVFLGHGAGSIGLAALASLIGNPGTAAGQTVTASGAPHHTPKAKRIIYLFQSGAPSQMDLFDPKPAIQDRTGPFDGAPD